MLNETQRELLTAAVDGELSARQEVALARLLESSGEARVLLRELRAVRQRLQRLPRRTAPPQLAARIMDRIAPTSPGTPGRWVPPRRLVRALPYAIAASVLLIAGLGVFWLTLISPESASHAPMPDLAQQDHPAPHPTVILPTRDVLGVSAVPHPPETLPDPRVTPFPDHQLAHQSPPHTADHPTEVAPPPRPMPDWIGAAFTARPTPLERVEVRLPLFASVAEFDRPDVLARLTDELSRESAFRLDLFATDSVQAMQLLLDVSQDVGLKVRLEPLAQDRLKKKQPAHWLFYTEALTSSDCVNLAARLAAQARARTGDTDRQLDGHFYPARALEQKNLRDLLGVDLGLGKRPPVAKSGSGTAHSVTAGTLSQIEKSLRGANSSDRLAICVLDQLAYLRTNPASLREIRQYLEDRGERKPST
ncbi:MAG: hypothetical protein LC104_10925, partial [Bacteroidales bacterium]|nr:hypothetical protein [Bacteroidales bacterium]